MPSWWPFGRRAEPEHGSPGPVPAPVVRKDWMRLPPIQRAIAHHPMTAPADRFNDQLVTHQDPTVLARSLGHEVSLEAPRGIVLGVAHAQERVDGPEMVQRPRRQRRPVAAGEPDLAESAPEPAMPAVPLLHLPVSEAATPERAPLLTHLSAEVDPMPLESPARARPSPQTLGRESARPEPAAAAAAAVAASATSQAKLTLGQSRRLGLGPPITQIPEPSLQRAPTNPPALTLKPSAPVTREAPLPVAAPSTEEDASPTKNNVEAPAAEAPAQLELATARPPTPAGQPLAASIQRAPATPAMEAPLTSDRPLSTGATPLASRSTPEQSDAAAVPSSGDPLPLATPVQRAAIASSPVEAAEASASAPPPGHDVGTARVEKQSGPAAGPPPSTAIAPLLSERPLRAVTAIQRSAELVPNRVQEEMGQALGMDVSTARVHRGSDAAGAAAAVQARAFTQGDDVFLPASHGPLDSGPARSLLAHELTHVAQQRRLGSSLPAEASPAGQQLEAEARGMESIWHGSASMPLAPRVQAAPAADQTSSTAAIEAMQATTRDLVAAGRASQAPDGSLIFRAPESVAAPAPAPIAATTTTVQRATAPATAAAPTQAGTSDADMAELARKLYEPLRARLRAELLVDRERAGMIADIR